ncbi:MULTISPECIES: pyridoxal 5'-phosphate synthase glutaminase subunit PdxT [Bacillus]|uniref:pyridoxal 5'-phosphate synthase glutaminase subunit PdxT n=1 Tax=Bacillus TaxID=1386 RepID=UPI0002E2FC01|nr:MULTISPECIES: pyridoxal 5'-phosphate synthase glutaminase subunit PdxT [Bacillus]
MKTIGVLGLQGAVQEHVNQIEAAGQRAMIIKHPEQLIEIDGLILPGGESTTMRHFIDLYDFLQPLKQFGQTKPIFGTCAGMVLLANELTGEEEAHLQLIDITVKRNAFGRQVDSFEAHLQINGMSELYPAVFIRAPFIEKVSSEVEILATYEGNIVAAKQNNILVTSFHPELTKDQRFMDLFIKMIKQEQKRPNQPRPA